MDAPYKIQGSIHVFRLVNNMCPGKWVHIKALLFFYMIFIKKPPIKSIRNFYRGFLYCVLPYLALWYLILPYTSLHT